MPRFEYFDSGNMSDAFPSKGSLEVDRSDKIGGSSPEFQHARVQHQSENLPLTSVKHLEDNQTHDGNYEFSSQLSVAEEMEYSLWQQHGRATNRKKTFGDCNLNRALVYGGATEMGDIHSSSTHPDVVGHVTRYPHELRYPAQSYSFQEFNGTSVKGMDEEMDTNDQSDDNLFVSNRQSAGQPPLIPRHRVDKSKSSMIVPTQPFTHANLIREESKASKLPLKKPEAPKTQGRGKSHIDPKSQNNELLPSRSSGACMPWPIHEAPKLVPTETVSDAYLQKRNLPRPIAAKIVKRASGANDPENLAIVNKYDFDQKSWEVIAKELNEERIRLGRVPTLTSNGVILRYNRTAPIYYDSLGQNFIPLKLRKKGGVPGEPFEFKDSLLVKWEPKHDDTLMRVVKQYDEAKWNTVANLMNKEFPGETFTAKGVAVRFRSQ